MFLICSLTSSFFITLSLISLYSSYKTSNIYALLIKMEIYTNANTQIFIEDCYYLSMERLSFIWVTLFLGFAFKMPLCPFYM
jgi:formate hydrogenlyase subunit 3/multisubunit Na+/H+ antiporter MnhD subunit